MLDQIVFFYVVSIIYFLPSIIGNKSKFFPKIFTINLFLGITIIGWFYAFKIQHDERKKRKIFW